MDGFLKSHPLIIHLGPIWMNLGKNDANYFSQRHCLIPTPLGWIFVGWKILENHPHQDLSVLA
jgi:hypothetical protein